MTITLLEITGGVLHLPPMAMRAFFYFPAPASLANVPADQRAASLAESLNCQWLDCPACGWPAIINAFAIATGWRPVAEAWRIGETICRGH